MNKEREKTNFPRKENRISSASARGRPEEQDKRNRVYKIRFTVFVKRKALVVMFYMVNF